MSKLNTRHMQLAWTTLATLVITDAYIAPGRVRRVQRPADRELMAAEVETHDFDVLIIGAGGAGLRAAIAAREAGMKTAIICKSLFGKAHTVMAEGGIAASMGNVNDKDNWQVHFRDTMRGGQVPELSGGWPNCTRRKRPNGSGNSRRTARCSTAPRKARSASATSAATSIRGWPTSATAPAWS